MNSPQILKTATCSGLMCLFAITPAWAMFHKEGPTPDEMRAEVQEMRTQTLNDLYKERPETKSEIQGAAGYAVFSNFGMNLFVVSTGRGEGVARNNKTGKDTYMNMFSAGGGLGMGVKNFRAVFVFHTASALDAFLTSGWDFSGQADAAASSGEKGEEGTGAAGDEALTVMPGTSIYQITDEGLALQATLQGTKYWVDDELN
ncbi:MAG: YSC84-related protein [Gammaproteobacteria bacterium]